MRNLPQSFSQLVGTTATASLYDESLDGCSIYLKFSNGIVFRCDYWRLSKSDGLRLSSFDHKQRYGLPAPIDAVAELQQSLAQNEVTLALLTQIGDVAISFSLNQQFEAFNFTGYEAWELRFPNGSVEYSNYN